MLKNIFLLVFIFTFSIFYGQNKTPIKFNLKKKSSKSCIVKRNKDTIFTSIGSIEALKSNKLEYIKAGKWATKYIR